MLGPRFGTLFFKRASSAASRWIAWWLAEAALSLLLLLLLLPCASKASAALAAAAPLPAPLAAVARAEGASRLGMKEGQGGWW
jgi:hypothetical protein